MPIFRKKKETPKRQPEPPKPKPRSLKTAEQIAEIINKMPRWKAEKRLAMLERKRILNTEEHIFRLLLLQKLGKSMA